MSLVERMQAIHMTAIEASAHPPANPMSANPMSANPMPANPMPANPMPALPEPRSGGLAARMRRIEAQAAGNGTVAQPDRGFWRQSVIDPATRGVHLGLANVTTPKLANQAQQSSRLHEVSRLLEAGQQHEAGILFNKDEALRSRYMFQEMLDPERRAAIIAEHDAGLADTQRFVGRHRQTAAQVPTSPAMVQFQQAEGWLDSLRAVRDNPSLIAEIVAESLPQAAPALAMGAVTGPAGFMAGTFQNTQAAEFYQGLAQQGVDTSDMNAVVAAIQDPETFETARRYATGRGAAISGAETLGFKIAGKTLAPRGIQSDIAKQAINIPAQSVTQGAIAGAAEAGSQYAATGQVNPQEVIAEFVGEAGGAPVDVMAATANQVLGNRPASATPSLAQRLKDRAARGQGIQEGPRPAPDSPEPITPPHGRPQGDREATTPTIDPRLPSADPSRPFEMVDDRAPGKKAKPGDPDWVPTPEYPFVSTPEEIVAFAQEAIEGKGNEKKGRTLGIIQGATAERIQADTGLNLNGYVHEMVNYELRHTTKHHGDQAKEAPRGQVAVTYEDYGKIPEIVAQPDDVYLSGRSKTGAQTITFTKRFNGSTLVIEEIRTKRGRLVPKTIRKFRGGPPKKPGADGGDPSAPSGHQRREYAGGDPTHLSTSETLRDIPNQNIAPKGKNFQALEPTTPAREARIPTEDAEFKYLPAAVRHIINKPRVKGQAGRQEAIWDSRIEPARASAISERVNADLGVNLNLSNSVHTIPSDAVRHAINEHGQDPLPLTPEDFAHIPGIVRQGQIVRGERTRDHTPGITFRGLVDGNWLYVVDAIGSTGSRHAGPILSFKTAYKTPGPKSGTPGPVDPGANPTERSIRQAAPSTGSLRPERLSAVSGTQDIAPDGENFQISVDPEFKAIAAAVRHVMGRPAKPNSPQERVWHSRIDHRRAVEIARRLKADIGLEADLRNSVHSIPANNAVHALNKHGSDPIPLTYEDFTHIPRIVREGEVLRATEMDGNRGVEYRALINGNWLHVVEVLSGINPRHPGANLTFKTAYWNQGPKSSKPGPKGPGADPTGLTHSSGRADAQAPTSETYPAVLGEATIAPKGDESQLSPDLPPSGLVERMRRIAHTETARLAIDLSWPSLDPGQLYDPVEIDRSQIVKAVKEFMARPEAPPDGRQEAVWYSRIAPARATQASETFRRDLGLEIDLRNSVHSIPANNTRHALNKHGRDPIPLKPEHFEHFPAIVRDGEILRARRIDENDGIEYRALIGGNWLHVVEVLGAVGKRHPGATLNFKTAYWNRGPKSKPDPEGPGSSLTERPNPIVTIDEELTPEAIPAVKGSQDIAPNGENFQALEPTTPAREARIPTEDAEFKYLPAAVRHIINKPRVKGQAGRQEAIWDSRIEPARASAISQRVNADLGVNLNLSNSVHTIPSDAVRHAINEHGHDPLPLTPEDFAHIPGIVRQGQIVRGERTRDHTPGITFRGLVYGDWLYVVSAIGSTGSRHAGPILSFKTAYKTPGPKSGTPGPVDPGANPTERPIRQADPSTGSLRPERLSAVSGTQDIAPNGENFQSHPDMPPSGLVERMHRIAESRQALSPGANYTGFVQAGVEGKTPARPIRREDVLRPLFKAFNVPLYEGRVRGKGVLGFYRPRLEEVRTKRANDIETAAHEMAHLLDDRVPEISRQWKTDQAIKEELRGVSYDRSKVYEGFAEFVRLWSTQKEQARAKAPRFYKWFEDFLNRSPYGPALRKSQEDMHAWFGQDALSRARSKVGVAKPINDGLTSLWSRFRQRALDDLDGIAKMERGLTGKLSPVGAYETARLTRGRHALTEGALLYGVPVVNKDGSHGFEGKGLQDILDPVASDLDDFLMYAVGRSAGELKGQGREHLFTGAEIDAMLALGRPKFHQAFAEYQKWNQGILDFAQAKGLINAEARRAWQRTQYLPFHRVGQPGAKEAVTGDWRGIKALTGGTENLRDILGNIIGNAQMLISASLTNEARLDVADLAKKQGGARFMAKIPTEDRRVRVETDQIESAILEGLGIRDIRALPVEQQQFLDQIMRGLGNPLSLYLHNQAPMGHNVVAALRDGRPEYYEVADPLLLSALQHLNRPTKHWIIRLLSVPKRIGQTSITLSADFMAANLARDTLMGTVMSRHGFRPILDSLRGMKSRLATDQNYKDFIANGGGFSSYMVDEDAFKTQMGRFYGAKGIDFRTVLNTPAKVLYALERLADAFEMSTRLGEFERAQKAGAHPRHAAYSAREVSTDFAMRGDSPALGFMYDTVMFLKAGVVGMDRLYRGLAHDPNRAAIAAKAATIAALSMGLYALNRGNPLYDDLEDWDKDTHWHFFIPTREALNAQAAGTDLPPLNERYHHFRYPKIWEVGALSSLGERGLERFLDDQPAKVGEDALRLLRNTFKLDYIPQFASPLVENFANHNRFLDRPIETQAMQSLQPWARSSPYGSATLRAMGEASRDLPRAFQASPAQVEALLRGYLNTWAMYGLTIADAAFFDDAPSLRADQYPVVRRFYQGTPQRHSRHVTELYEVLREATEARRTMRHMDKTYRPGIAGEIEHTSANLAYGHLSRANKQMQAISAEMRAVVNMPSLRDLQDYARDLKREQRFKARIGKLQMKRDWQDIGDLKRELLDLWTEERNAYAKEVMTDLKANPY